MFENSPIMDICIIYESWVKLGVGTDTHTDRQTWIMVEFYYMGESMWKVRGKRSHQKVKFLSLNRNKNKATGHKSTFLASLFFFLGPFWLYWVETKICLFLENHISKIDFITLKTKFSTSNYIFMLHMTQIKIFISNFTTNSVFTIKVPVKNAFLGSCHRFQEINILPKQFCRTKKNFRLMPKSSDLGQLKPKWTNG